MAYLQDALVKLKESASLVPCNLAVLHKLEESSVVYGVIHKNQATITHVMPATSKFKCIDSDLGSEREGLLTSVSRILKHYQVLDGLLY